MSFPPEFFDKYPSLRKMEEMGADYTEWKDGREQRLLEHIYSHPELEQMRGNPTKLLACIDAFTIQHDFMVNVGPDKGAKVVAVIAQEKPRAVVELGTYLGYSAIMFASAMRAALVPMPGSPADPEEHGLQYWTFEEEPLFAAIAMSLVDLAGLRDVVHVVTGPADESLRRLHAAGQLSQIDMLFLDHGSRKYVPHLKLCEELSLFRPGATVVADNMLIPGAPDYREYVRSHPGMNSSGVEGLVIPGEFEDELEISKFKN